MRNLHMISRTIYMLKRDFSGVVDFYIETKGALNLETGVRTVTRPLVRVSRCVVLDGRSMLKYLGKDQAAYDHRARFFIVERNDFPRNYLLTKDHYMVYNHRRYEIDDIKEIEANRGFLIVGVETSSKTVKETQSGYITQRIDLRDELEVTIE